MRVALISCSKTKRQGVHKAKDLYCSTIFRMAWRYASDHNDRVFILSAKHGLLHPEERIRSYDLALGDMSIEERRRWGADVASVINRSSGIAPEITFLCGKQYWECILPHVEGAIRTPLEGLRIGQHLKWYRERI